jgi:hypothetical protein
MNNLQTNNRRLVRKNESAASKAREHCVGWILEQWQESKNLPSKVVILAFSPIGAPRNAGRVRHYNLYGGQSQRMSDRGGENHAG